MPETFGKIVTDAADLGIRVQMIRRPGRRLAGAAGSVFAGWTAGSDPWLRRADLGSGDDLSGLDLQKLAAGSAPGFGVPVREPVLLVCTHGRRNACCARFGAPLAAALASRYPGQVWETTHVGGHRFAANLVIMPHGLYYGPVGVETADAAIGAYQRGAVLPGGYRGRAGQAKAVQEAEYSRLARDGVLEVGALGGRGD
jgi:hypothetical protein